MRSFWEVLESSNFIGNLILILSVVFAMVLFSLLLLTGSIDDSQIYNIIYLIIGAVLGRAESLRRSTSGKKK